MVTIFADSPLLNPAGSASWGKVVSLAHESTKGALSIVPAST
jgi:hypothetical protein